VKINIVSREKFPPETQIKVYKKTDGCCHICSKKLAKKNYGVIGSRGAWEIDHSIPISKGGSNGLNNLQPCCIKCNRTKGSSSTQSARRKHGKTAAPLSKRQKQVKSKQRVAKGVALGAMIGMVFSPVGAAIGAVVGGTVSSD